MSDEEGYRERWGLQMGGGSGSGGIDDVTIRVYVVDGSVDELGEALISLVGHVLTVCCGVWV